MARRLGGWVRRATWRVLHPDLREPYLRRVELPELELLPFATRDGWRSVVHVLPARPGASGEPVVVAHALGVSPDAFRLDDRDSLVAHLRRAGFAVYLLTHRGDPCARAPSVGATFDFDDVLERDLPAALREIRAHCGAARVHFIGHGLGGHLGLAHAGRGYSDDLASLTVLGAPARFEPSSARSEARRAARALAFLPAHWRLPSASLAWAVAPWVRDGASLGLDLASEAPGDLMRSLLCLGSQDVAVGLARQVARWQRTGVWSDRTGLLDYAATLRGADAPLFAISVAADGVACASHTTSLWGAGPTAHLSVPGGRHLDPLIGERAPEQVFAPIVQWLDQHRHRSWGGVDPHRQG
ncbi:MAG: alpha/beta fold hydrolase [Deltaproteobacteria bacterium]|nr:MAG: alpha/beta fold hydrolase [Deltaproteobacteria bacterium]